MKKILAFLLIFFAPFFVFKDQVLATNQASSSSQKKIIEVKKDEVIDQDFFAQGNDIKINGIINGDAYLIGGNLYLNGKINGDLIAAGGNLFLNGEITQDARVAGNNVFVKGKIGRNLTVLGGQINVEETTLDKNLLALGETIKISSPIGQDLRIYGDQVFINSQIGRNFKGSFSNLTLAEKTKILGNLDYQSPQEAQILNGATILGQTNYRQLSSDSWRWSTYFPKRIMPLFFGLAGLALWFKIMAFLIALGFGLLFFYFFPKRVEKMSQIMGKRFWACFGWGLLVPFIFILTVIFLILTLVGIPFIFILLPLFGLLLYFAKLFTAFFLGRKILGEKKAWGWALLLGLSIYYLLSFVFVLNGIASLFFTALGLGAFILDQKNLRKTTSIALKTSKKK